MTQSRPDLPGEEVHEAKLLVADLRDVDRVEATVEILADRSRVTFRIRSTGDLLGDHLLGHVFGGLLEVCRSWKLLVQLPRDAAGRPPIMGNLASAPFVLGPTHLDGGNRRSRAPQLAISAKGSVTTENEKPKPPANASIDAA